jgi:hypothetical protein
MVSLLARDLAADETCVVGRRYNKSLDRSAFSRLFIRKTRMPGSLSPRPVNSTVRRSSPQLPMFSFRKKRVAPNVLADVLLTEFIADKDENARFNLRWPASDVFQNKVARYKLALVLLALLAAEQKDARYEQVKTHLEKLVFSPDIADGMPFFLQVKSAMDEISQLLDARDNPAQWMTWAQHWLEDVGINETNPAVTFQFALLWTDNYVTIAGALNDFHPK